MKKINIKGKEYIPVSERILYFNENYPNGSITTEIVPSMVEKQITIKATVTPDITQSRVFTGHSQAVMGQGMVNSTAALENAETSAIGRALGFMGIGVIDSIASSDEMAKADVPFEDSKGFGNCVKCGAARVKSAKGTIYCSAMCWKKD